MPTQPVGGGSTTTTRTLAAVTQTPPTLPPQDAVILKGWRHLKTQLSQVLPTELRNANLTRRGALMKLSRGKL